MNGTDIETSEYRAVAIGATTGSVTPASSQATHDTDDLRSFGRSG